MPRCFFHRGDPLSRTTTNQTGSGHRKIRTARRVVGLRLSTYTFAMLQLLRSSNDLKCNTNNEYPARRKSLDGSATSNANELVSYLNNLCPGPEHSYRVHCRFSRPQDDCETRTRLLPLSAHVLTRSQRNLPKMNGRRSKRCEIHWNIKIPISSNKAGSKGSKQRRTQAEPSKTHLIHVHPPPQREAAVLGVGVDVRLSACPPSLDRSLWSVRWRFQRWRFQRSPPTAAWACGRRTPRSWRGVLHHLPEILVETANFFEALFNALVLRVVPPALDNVVLVRPLRSPAPARLERFPSGIPG